MRRYKWILISVLLMLVLLVGCGKEQESGTVYQIYTVNKEETKVNAREFVCAKGEEPTVEVLIEQLSTALDESSDKPAIREDMFAGWAIDGNHVLLDFSKDYQSLSPIAEVLSRAAVVRTLCQLSSVEYVSFRIDGEELMNQNGVIVGLMNADQFVENDGKEINSYEKVTLTLYFTDEEGQVLHSQKREKIYNSNISLEKLVMEQLILGPTEKEGGNATLDPATKVISVTVKDGTCYVNLDSSCLNQVGNVSAPAAVYSIVNSLTELTNVNKVQISVDGEMDISYRETVSLSQALERDYEIVE